VRLVAVEKIIGVGGSLGVTIHLSGDVAAVTSSVEAGTAEAQRIGKVITAHVIAKAHEDVSNKILSKYLLDKGSNEPMSAPNSPAGSQIAAGTTPDKKLTKAKPHASPKNDVLHDSSDSTNSNDKPN
jgi:ethanolamine utilization protein EutM